MRSNDVALWKDEAVLNRFLDRWTVSRIKEMTLDEYTDIHNSETFTRWVEGKTRSLGSINAIMGSAKFGIYKRENPRKPKGLFSNDTYSWIKYYGECAYNENTVFEKVKAELLKLIGFAQTLNFKAVENSNGFYELYKWKLAFLYSNQSFIPVFNQKFLVRFTQEIPLTKKSKIEYTKRHRLLYEKKPNNTTVFNFMRQLIDAADAEDNKVRKKRRRKAADDLDTSDYNRSGTEPSVVTQVHRKMQKRLKQYLKSNFSKAEITFEKNYIDVLMVSNEEVHFYEVKTGETPESCIRQGLGQLLSYSFHEEVLLKKYKGLKSKIVIFGTWRADKNDRNFIEYVNKSLKVNFEYLSLEEI